MFLGRNNQALRWSFQPYASQFVLTHSWVFEITIHMVILKFNYDCLNLKLITSSLFVHLFVNKPATRQFVYKWMQLNWFILYIQHDNSIDQIIDLILIRSNLTNTPNYKGFKIWCHKTTFHSGIWFAKAWTSNNPKKVNLAL